MINRSIRTLEEKILTHKRLYEEACLEIPPYFITYSENLVLGKKLREAFNLGSEHGLIEYYVGVEIKVCIVF